MSKNKDKTPQYYLYTDGSCENLSPYGEGGYAYVIVSADGNILSQFAKGVMGTTNNRMELTAIIEGCKAIVENGSNVVIVSDSEYAINVLSNRWQPKTNQDLIAQHEENKKRLHLKYRWVKGHNGNKFNELADHLAQSEKINIQAEHGLTPINYKAHEALMNFLHKPLSAPDKELPVKKEHRPKQKFDYRIYIMAVSSFGLSFGGYVITNKNTIIKEETVEVIGTIGAALLQTVVDACNEIKEDDVSVQVISNSKYVVNILKGKWKPQKNLSIIAEQKRNMQRIKVSYKLLTKVSGNLKRALKSAKQELHKEMPDVEHYQISGGDCC